MHVEESPPNGTKGSEVLTVTRDLINLDSIRKRILGSPIEKEEPYEKNLKIEPSKGLARTCSIPLAKYINFYRDLDRLALPFDKADFAGVLRVQTVDGRIRFLG